MAEAPVQPRTPVDLVVTGDRVLTPEGFVPAAVVVSGSTIVAVTAPDQVPDAVRVVTLAADEVLVPGLVDSHVHVNEPGRTEWEGFATATRAALAGGVTTIVDMPLNSIPPTTSVAALAEKRASARGQAAVDVAFWGGAVPDSLGHLAELHDAGVVGFKCFLLDSGVPEFPPLDADQLKAAMAEIAAFDGLLIVHAEDPDTIARCANHGGPRFADFLASRPTEAETRAVATVIDAARATGCRCHVVHVSDAETAAMVATAVAEGVRITAETCPHYLVLHADEVPDGHTEFKCCPPVRSAGNADRLWDALAAGQLGIVVSDHSPSTPEMKFAGDGDFAQAWGGIASLQLSLALVWTEAQRRGVDLAEVVRWMAAGPAALVGLAGRKGSIEVGADADLVVLAPDEELVVDAAGLQHRNAISPYQGRTLRGVVRHVVLGGRSVRLEDDPGGRLLVAGGSTR